MKFWQKTLYLNPLFFTCLSKYNVIAIVVEEGAVIFKGRQRGGCKAGWLLWCCFVLQRGGVAVSVGIFMEVVGLWLVVAETDFVAIVGGCFRSGLGGDEACSGKSACRWKGSSWLDYVWMWWLASVAGSNVYEGCWWAGILLVFLGKRPVQENCCAIGELEKQEKNVATVVA